MWPQSEARLLQGLSYGWNTGVHATKSALGPFSFQTGVQLQTGGLTDIVLLRSNSAMQRTRQEARDALQQLLPPTKIIHDDPAWAARSCQFHAVLHALQQVNYPNPLKAVHDGASAYEKQGMVNQKSCTCKPFHHQHF